MSVRRIAERSAVLFWLTSAVNVSALVLAGLALAIGLLPGPRDPLLTVLPAGAGLLVLAVFLMAPRGARHLPGHRQISAATRATADTVTDTVRLLAHPDWRLTGALAYPGADITVLWCCLAALGVHAPAAVLVLAYFLGYLPNILPIPGGIGVIDTGLVGALVLYHLPAADVLTGVLLYHTIALWLPTIGGTIALIGARHDLHPPPTAHQANDYFTVPAIPRPAVSPTSITQIRRSPCRLPVSPSPTRTSRPTSSSASPPA